MRKSLISPCVDRSVFVLERLSDDDIKTIVTQAIERVSEQSSEKTALPTPSPNDLHADDSSTDDNFDVVASSQPDIEEPLTQPSPSQDSTAPTPSPAVPSSSADTSPFLVYPHVTSKVLSTVVALSIGDARTALSLIELVLAAPTTSNEGKLLAALRRSVATAYDRGGDSHYDMISALHKSVRGSQGSAALYWLARMLTAGEDPLYIARRMVVCASEDIGLADNHALPLVRAILHPYSYAFVYDTSQLMCFFYAHTGYGGVPGMSSDRDARMSHQPRASRIIPLGGTQVDACIRGVQTRGGGSEARPVHSCASRDAKRADEAHEGTRILTGIPIQSGVRVRHLRLSNSLTVSIRG